MPKWRFAGMIIGGLMILGVALTTGGSDVARMAGGFTGLAGVIAGIVLLVKFSSEPWF